MTKKINPAHLLTLKEDDEVMLRVRRIGWIFVSWSKLADAINFKNAASMELTLTASGIVCIDPVETE
jgi:hypothetical protein